jgi:hypothetical protein
MYFYDVVTIYGMSKCFLWLKLLLLLYYSTVSFHMA